MATLRELREAAGLTQEQLAGKLLISPERIAAWESGAQVPTQMQARRLAAVLGLRPAAVLAALGKRDERGE